MRFPLLLAGLLSLLFTLAHTRAAERVALKVDWPGEDNPPGGFPIYCGLSLPRGLVQEAAEVHLETAEGQFVPVEVEPLAKWVPEPSLRWVGLHFLAKRGVKYVAVIGPKTAQPRGIEVKRKPDSIYIDTGAVTVELPQERPLTGFAWVHGQGLAYSPPWKSAAGGAGRMVVRDAAGRVADETEPEEDSSQKQTIELEGSQSVVVRREGHFRTAKGELLGRYIVRLAFQAGSGLVKMQHTFINTEDTNQLQYADLSVNLRPPTRGEYNNPTELWPTAIEPSPNAAPLVSSIQPWQGDATYLLQANYPHHGRQKNRQELMLRRGKGPFASLLDDTKPAAMTGNWAAVQGSEFNVLMVLPNLARLFPKELEISNNGLVAHLWSSRGGRLLDYRPATLADHWGTAWLDKAYPGGTEAMRKLSVNAQGTARTHDLWLGILPWGPPADAAPLGRLCANPPTCVQDPAWLRKTEALGFIHPYDPEHFPALEKFVRHFTEEYLVKQQERWGDYGFLDFGCGPHSYQNTVAIPGLEQPRIYRYSDMMYHGQTALWQAYARSGDRLYRDYAQQFHRHLADFKFAHAPGPQRTEGARIGGGISEESPIYWAGTEDRFGGGLLNGHQGFDAEGFLLQRYLTGDRWGEECIVKSGEAMLARLHPEVLPEIGASSDGAQPFLTAAALYRHTGDARYLKFLDQVRERMVDLRTITGSADPNYYGAWEKYPIKAAGVLADYLATGSPVSRQAFEKALPIMLWDAPITTTGYQDEMGLFANHGWRLTGNLRYAEYIEERFNRVLFEYIDAEGRDRVVSAAHGGPHGGGVHGFNFLETAFYGMDLLAATEGKRRPYLALDTGPRNHPVEIHFAKDWHEPLTFELRQEARPDLEVTWSSHERGRPGRNAELGVVRWDAQPLYFSPDVPGLGGGFARLEMGAETVGGEYRLTNVPLIFTHQARKLVMSAPDGVILRANSVRPPRWYFQVPAGKSGGVYANKPIVLQRGGQVVPTKPGEWTELAGGAADDLVTLETSGLVFVRFRGGLPPVLAAHDPALFFVPKVVAETMPAREAATIPLVTQERFQPGLIGEAYSLAPGRTLEIPRGSKIAEGRYQFLHYDAGTLEFWFQPHWSTGSATKPSNLNFLIGAFWPCSIRHNTSDDQDPRSAGAFMLNAPGVGAFPTQQLINNTPVREQQWHHIAISWTIDPERGWLSELYVDGRAAIPWARAQTGLGRFLETEPAKQFPPMPWPIGEPTGESIKFLGDVLNGAIDELRISRTPRYPRPFAPLPQRRFEMDDESLLLMHFDGDTKQEIPQRAP